MSFAAVAVGVGSAVAGAAASSAFSGGGGGGGSQQAASAADPFASQRGQYQGMLSNLINNPSSITSTPGYQFGLTQSQNAVTGSAAANGMVNSGNVLSALSNNAQGYASTQLNNQELLLAQLSGANVGSPGEAGSILQGQNQLNQQAGGALGNQVGSAVTSGFNNFANNGGFNFGVSNTGSENPGASSSSTPDDLIGGYSNRQITAGMNAGASAPFSV
jgi:hypothetical protein